MALAEPRYGVRTRAISSESINNNYNTNHSKPESSHDEIGTYIADKICLEEEIHV